MALCFAAQAAWAQATTPLEPDGGPIRAAGAAGAADDTVNTAGGKAQATATGIVSRDVQASSESSAEITVTGTRIVRDGYNSPTPVSVLSSTDIQAQAPANLADFVNTLPSIAGSTTPATGTAALSAGTAGISALNLRSLGANRTLVLIDGQRSVASSATGLVDINTIPQDLVERVEVVTGGASAAYGSDAVGGVVNFILNKNFKGFRAKTEFGQTTYGDGTNYKFNVTAGVSLLDDRLHLVANAEYYNLKGINFNTRKWNNSNYFMMTNPAYAAGNGQPERLVGYNIGPAALSPGGLITGASVASVTAALRGTYFGTINPATGLATTGQLAFGAVSGFWMQGGDYQYTSQNYRGNNSLLPGEERESAFGRASFDVTSNIELFAQFSYNRYKGYSVYIPSVTTTVVQYDNAYLPANVAAALAPTKSSITVGSTNQGFPVGGARNEREVFRYVAGGSGKFGLFDRDWKWEAYYQYGQAKPHEELFGTYNNARFAAASDAIFATAANIAAAGSPAGISVGQIVCRNTLSTNATTRATYANCVPINRIGIGGETSAAINYVIPSNPQRDQKLTESVGSLTISGSLFRLPAGPVSIAFGGEYRREHISGFVDPQYNSGWEYGNYLVNRGGYNVGEGFIELAVPVFKGLDLNGAGRFTHYSTSGSVQTWKVGATYQLIPDIRLRATYSHDIRAPNLDELFAAGTGRSNTVTVLNQSVPYVQFQTGNPDLQPEKANSINIGVVMQPRWVRGLSLSVDYYQIEIKDAIGVFQPQDVADLCYNQNIAAQCANIASTGTAGAPGFAISNIFLKPFNFQSQKERGLDIEASYRTRLDSLFQNIPGEMQLRALFTHYIEDRITTGFGFPTDTAGQNTNAGPPSWIYRLSALYSIKPITFNLIARGISAGKVDNSFVQCTASCPLSTAQNRTINDNHVPGALYFDTSISFDFTIRGLDTELQVAVNNVFNKDPALVANTTTSNSTPASPQTNRMYYDYIGRVFRLAAKFKF